MKSKLTTSSTAMLALIGSLLASPALLADGHGNGPVEIYFTRHAEKTTEQEKREDGSYIDICGEKKCAEILNAQGRLRASLLADWFAQRGITDRLSHAFSSHKQRTRQTIELIAGGAKLSNDNDQIADGVQQLPADGKELDPESTKGSVQLTVDALNALPGGSVAVVAAHSGTIYPILAGLGIDTSNDKNFPKDTREGKEGKVPTFGDIWKVMLNNGEARLVYRINLQPGPLRVQP